MSTAALSTWEGFKVEIDQRSHEIATQLPSNVKPERFINAAIAAVKQTPDILKATPRSLFAAVTKAAQDGLLPDGREGVITVYSQKVKGRGGAADYWENVAQWNPMIYGLRKRARELDGIIIDAQVVYENDFFDWDQGDDPHISHKPAQLGTPRGRGIGAYAIFRHPTAGILHREVMDADAVQMTREQSRAKDSLMWTKFWTEGWRKSVVRRGVKSVPVSSALERVLTRDDETFDFVPPPAQRLAPPPPPADEEDASEQQTAAEADLPSPDATSEPERAPEPDKPATKAAPAATKPAEPATPPTPPMPPEDDGQVPDTSDVGRFLHQIDETLATVGDADDLDRLWDELDVTAEFSADEDALTRAFDIKKRHAARLERVAVVAAGQGDLLGGGN